VTSAAGRAGEPAPVLRRLAPADAEAFAAFRRAYLEDAPLAFGASPESDFLGSADSVRRQIELGDASVIFGVFAPGLVAAVGLYRERRPKTAHKAHVWGMYVTPAHRGRGYGRRLLEAAVAHARTLAGVTVVHLSVTEAAPGARRLYESAGFEVWGSEPEGMRHGDRALLEHHMIRRL